ncbi:MAG: hypothetical protein NTW14_09985 [bacterium]|nr:hypothetical protein [bacterium]
MAGIMSLFSSDGYKSRLLPYLLLFLVGAVLLSPLCRGFFYYDDFDYLDSALRVLYEASTGKDTLWASFRSDFITHGDYSHNHYRPAAYFLTTVLVWLKGTRYIPFAILSITLHIICAMVLYALAQRLFKDRIKAFLAALLFLCQNWGIHAVLWIGAAVNYVPSVLFLICVLLLFFKYLETRRILFLLLSALCLYFQLSFHEEAQVTILVLFLLYRYEQNISSGKRWWSYFVQPVFYPYYVVYLLWFIQSSAQSQTFYLNSQLRTITKFFSFKAISAIYASFNLSVSQFIEQLSSLTANSAINQIFFWLIVLTVFGFFSLALTLFFTKSQRLFRFLSWWLLLELLPRIVFKFWGSRGLYMVCLPGALMSVVMIYWLAEQMLRWWRGRKYSPSQIAAIMVLILLVIQSVHIQYRINGWNWRTRTILGVQEQLFEQTGQVTSDQTLVFMAPTPEQDKMIDKYFFTEQLHVAFNRYDLDLRFLPYDSVQAGLLSAQAMTKVVVGTPGAYFRYRPDLPVTSLIPNDLTERYQWFQQAQQSAKERRSKYKRR